MIPLRAAARSHSCFSGSLTWQETPSPNPITGPYKLKEANFLLLHLNFFSSGRGSSGQFRSAEPEKSTLWTNTGVGQNFQRDLGAIGLHEFQGKFIWTNGPFALFSGKFVWTNGAESSSKVSPETGIGPWMALPRELFLCQRERRRIEECSLDEGSRTLVMKDLRTTVQLR